MAARKATAKRAAKKAVKPKARAKAAPKKAAAPKPSSAVAVTRLAPTAPETPAARNGQREEHYSDLRRVALQHALKRIL